MKNRKLASLPFIITGFLFLILFGVVAWGVHTEKSWITSFDLAWIDKIQSTITEGKTAFFIKITDLGSMELVIVLTILFVLVLFFKRRFAEGLWLGGTILVCAAIATKILKKLFDRDRPVFLQLITETKESFPSGHATATTIFYGLIGLILFLAVVKLWMKFIVAFITLAWIVFIMVTRVYLGVHFPTDVLGGFLFGIAVVFISVGAYLIARDPLRNLLSKLKLKDRSESFVRSR